MLDVKKLITGFLILALGASASAWILSAGTNPFQVSSSGPGTGVYSSSTVSGSAFAESNSEPQDIETLLAGGLPSSTEAALSDPNNLTAAMGDSLLDGLVSANPDGIQTDDNGDGEVNQPDNQAILTELAGDQAAQNIQSPNWDIEVAEDEASMKISQKPTHNDIEGYMSSFNDINQKYFIQTGLVQAAENASTTDVADLVLDPSTIMGSAPEISGALTAALQMNVPAPFAPFQKSFIKLLVYEKNTALLFNSISTDPARSVLALDVEENSYDAAVDKFNTERENLLSANIVAMESNPSERNDLQSRIVAFVNNLDGMFSVQSAHAQTPAACEAAEAVENAKEAARDQAALAAKLSAVNSANAGVATGNAVISVPVSEKALDTIEQSNADLQVQQLTQVMDQAIAAETTACVIPSSMTWGTYLLNLAKNIGLQILKNTLLAQLQHHIVKWIQGSGAPMFVQNWANDLANAGIMSATNWINGNFSCIGTAQMPRIQIVLNALYKPGNNACAAQFASQLSSANLTSFMKNFTSGGFVSFGQTLLPSNNFYGGLIFTAQNAQQASQQAKSVFTIKTTSQQGMKGSETCGDSPSDNPQGFHCVDANNKISYPSGGSCPSGTTQVQNLGSCADGSNPTTQSPALISGAALGSGVTMGGKQILSANDVGGIVAAFANSLINAITSQIVSSASGAINGVLNGTPIMSVNPDSLLSATSTNSALMCSPASATASAGATTLFTASGGFDSNGNVPTYYWQSSDGQSGSGPMFSPTYTTPGNYTITLGDSNGDASTTCSVGQSSSTPVACSPNTQTITFASSTGQSSVTVSAQGGAASTSSSPSYIWTAPGSVSTTISYPGFQAVYNTTGTFNISVLDSVDNSTSTCQVILQ